MNCCCGTEGGWSLGASCHHRGQRTSVLSFGMLLPTSIALRAGAGVVRKTKA